MRAAADAAEAAEAEGVEPGEIPRLNLEPTVEDAFQEGLARLRQRDTWKLWRWPLADKVFYTPDEYKCAQRTHALFWGPQQGFLPALKIAVPVDCLFQAVS